MNLLVTGRGTGGSWQIRGEQLGRAIGATVLARAIDIAPFDAAVVVKRPDMAQVQRAHAADVPVIWDIVDAWPQPAGNDWDREQCMAWLREMVAAINPAALVAATQAMADDCREFGRPVLALPHHARPGLRRTPMRELRTVGYEGGEQHLGQWAQWLREECKRRGLEFVVNPDSISDLDVVVALREVNGYAPRNWKSGVKLANAQASGTPIICGREAGYMETASGVECWADTPEQVAEALDWLVHTPLRAEIAERLAAKAPSLAITAATYRAWLHAEPWKKAPRS